MQRGEEKASTWLLIGLISLLVAITVFLLGSRGESSFPSKGLVVGRFPDGCPPRKILASAQRHPPKQQEFDEEFLALFQRLKLIDGTQALRLEGKGFCLSQINGITFGLFRRYVRDDGAVVSGLDDLRTWLEEQGIDPDNICQVIWMPCPSVPTPVPVEKESEIVWAHQSNQGSGVPFPVFWIDR